MEIRNGYTLGVTMEPQAERSTHLWIIPVVLALLVFGQVATFEFVNFDDDKLIFGNPNINAPTLDGLKFHWTQFHSYLYIPVTYTAWWTLAHIALVQNNDTYALNPWIFHGANLLCHLLNVAMVWKILLRLLGDDRAVVLGAILFAIHPLQAEPVSWATGLKDVLSASFALSAILIALQANDDLRMRAARWVACGSMMILAALSKPSAIVTPFIILAILWAVGSKFAARVGLLCFGAVLSAGIVYITRKAQPALDLPPVSAWTRPLIATDSLAFYISKVIVPLQLTIDHGRTPAYATQSGAIWWTWIVPVIGFALTLLSRNRLIQLGAIVFIIALLPTLGLTRFQFQVFSTVSDRYAYLSLFGAAIVLAGLVDRWPKLHWPLRAFLGLCVVLAFIQSGTWKDSQSLWQHTIKVNDRSALGYHNLGQVALEQRDFSSAIDLFKRAAEADADDAFSWLSLARTQMSIGQTAESARSIERFVQAYSKRSNFDPELTAEMLRNFEIACRNAGDFESADRLQSLAQKIMFQTTSGR